MTATTPPASFTDPATRPNASRTAAPAPMAGLGIAAGTAAAWAAAYAAWRLLGAPATTPNWLGPLGLIPPAVAAAWTAWPASAGPEGIRRARLLLAVSCLLIAAGAAAEAWSIRSGTAPAYAAAICLSAGHLVLALALVTVGRSHPDRPRPQVAALDAAVGAVAVVIGGWFVLARATAPEAAPVAAAALHVVAAAALIAAASLPRLGRWVGGPLAGARWLTLAALTAAVTDAALAVQFAAGGTTDPAATDLLAVAALVPLVVAAAGLRRAAPARDWPQEIVPVPASAVGLAAGLLGWVAVAHPAPDLLLPAALGALAIFGLAGTRLALQLRSAVRDTTVHHETRLRLLTEHATDLALVLDHAGTVRWAGHSAERVLRAPAAALVGRVFPDLAHPDDHAAATDLVGAGAARAGLVAPATLRLAQTAGEWVTVEALATNALAEPAVRGIVVNLRDIGERRRLERELAHQAYHDQLTGLANKARFQEVLGRAVAVSVRTGQAVTVLFIDLDDFHRVNDRLGHEAGDLLLIAAAERLRSCLQAADTLARMGGNGFAVLTHEAAGSAPMQGLLERIGARMAEPFVIQGHELQLSASIGVATASGGETADDVLRHANRAMCAAKQEGKGQHVLFQSRALAAMTDRLELEVALRGALERGELAVEYQPFHCLRTGALRGVQVLPRWRHPARGDVPPHRFLAMAEDSGAIVRIGNWVLREACQHARRWRERRPDLDLSVSVRMTERQLAEPGLAAVIGAAVGEAGVAPSALLLEVPQALLGKAQVAERLRALRAIGVRIAVADLEGGFPAPDTVRRVGADTLRLARPMVEDLTAGGDRATVARAVLGVAGSLGLVTVAEGVETAAQHGALVTAGVELGQGPFLWGSAGPGADAATAVPVPPASAPTAGGGTA